MISKEEDGKLNYIHIYQAIKVLLPREYIARYRQKRHWASKFLPGKEPLNPEHDIVLFGDVAIKVSDGKTFYLIARVERIESTKDGSAVLSFKLKDNPQVRVRCSVYDRNNDGYYEVGDDIVLTSWSYFMSRKVLLDTACTKHLVVGWRNWAIILMILYSSRRGQL